MIADATAGSEHLKLLVTSRLREIARDQTAWQWVIHGDTSEYRAACVHHLCRAGALKRGRRMALCGRGDLMQRSEDGETYRIKRKSCKERCCPRCSKRRGMKALKRVNEHLASRGHGEIWHIVLTQMVVAGEPLVETRKRFERAWSVWWRRAKVEGIIAGLATYHLKWSRWGGWHWHCHLMCEFAEAVDGEERFRRLATAWEAAKGVDVGRETLYGRRVAPPGSAIPLRTDAAQMDFWQEDTDAVARALQYLVRDVLQGVESWVGDIIRAEKVDEFVDGMNHSKMHRLLGLWRFPIKAEKEVEPEKEMDEGVKPPPGPCSDSAMEVLGTVDWVFYRARQGVTMFREAVERFGLSSCNQSAVGVRLSKVVLSVLRDEG